MCWYDRRGDPNNFLIARWCATSKDGGVKWKKNKAKQKKGWAAVPAQDLLINPVYMGDYDSLASDSTNKKPGFIGAFAENTKGNPDINAVKFK